MVGQLNVFIIHIIKTCDVTVLHIVQHVSV
jgi:hypothetical protein